MCIRDSSYIIHNYGDEQLYSIELIQAVTYLQPSLPVHYCAPQRIHIYADIILNILNGINRLYLASETLSGDSVTSHRSACTTVINIIYIRVQLSQ